jgi:uncharacterized membrane protein YkvA (DUF1232 family)
MKTVDAIRIVMGVIAAMSLTWLLLVGFLVIVRPRGISLNDARRFVPDLARLLADLSRHSEVSRKVRRRLAMLLAYLAMPIDLIPDFIPVLGYADDIIVIAYVLRSIVRTSGPEALENHWRGSPEGLRLLRQLAGIQP